jgi:ribosomal protein L37E
MGYSDKPCEECGVLMLEAHVNKKFCSECRVARNKRNVQKWELKNRRLKNPIALEPEDEEEPEGKQRPLGKRGRYPEGFNSILHKYKERHKEDFEKCLQIAKET